MIKLIILNSGHVSCLSDGNGRRMSVFLLNIYSQCLFFVGFLLSPNLIKIFWRATKNKSYTEQEHTNKKQP